VKFQVFLDLMLYCLANNGWLTREVKSLDCCTFKMEALCLQHISDWLPATQCNIAKDLDIYWI